MATRLEDPRWLVPIDEAPLIVAMKRLAPRLGGFRPSSL